MIIKLFYGQNAQRKRDMKMQCWPWHGFISMEQEQHRIYAGRRNGMKKFLQSIPGMFRRYSVLVKYIFTLGQTAKTKSFCSAAPSIRHSPITPKNIITGCRFAGSETGGQRLAILYSFAATCKANNICFRQWLEDVLPRLSSTSANQIESLLPPNWKPVSE